jgi:transaldolase
MLQKNNMRPQNLKTKIFLDSGDPKETQDILNVLGFLDGQTTNPSLVSKNPEVQEKISKGGKFTQEELYEEYKKLIQKISGIIPNGSVSIEVYADKTTTAEEMFNQGRAMYAWIPNAHIKFPTTHEGLKAAQMAIERNLRVNMTLVFSLQQAAAIYNATRGAKRGDVYISPFIGRLDDQGENGIDLVKNIKQLYKEGDNHIDILAASVRNLEHLYNCFAVGADIVTVPAKVLYEWKASNLYIPERETSSALKPILFEKILLQKEWEDYDLHHELTDKGIEKFVTDWKSLIYV